MVAKIKIHVHDEDQGTKKEVTKAEKIVKSGTEKKVVSRKDEPKKKVVVKKTEEKKTKNLIAVSDSKISKSGEVMEKPKGLLREKIVEEIENSDFEEVIKRRSPVSDFIAAESKGVVEDDEEMEEWEEGEEEDESVDDGRFVQEVRHSDFVSGRTTTRDGRHDFSRSATAMDENLAVSPDDDVHGRRSVGLYRKLAYSFAALTMVLVAAVFYFSSVRVTITLIPDQERINSSMIFDVYDYEKEDNQVNGALKGVVREVSISEYDNYQASGEEVIGKEAVGKVKLVNNHNQSQKLVATTRLLPVNDQDKMFRLTDTVIVPAGGSIEADIYADQPSPEMAIGASKFTIPGLWAGLQEKIYAESSEKVTYRQKVKKHIAQSDIDDSIQSLKGKLLDGAKESIGDKYGDYGQVIYKVDESSIKSTVNAKANEEKEEFTSSIEADVIVVAFDGTSAANLAKQKFSSSVEEGKEMLSFDDGNIIYTLNNYDALRGSAAVSASFEGKISLKQGVDVIDKKKIIGLNKEQLNAYLTGLDDIAGYEIKFYPPFIKSIPRLIEESKISVEIKK